MGLHRPVLRGRLILPVVALVGFMGLTQQLVLASLMDRTGARLAHARAEDLTQVVAMSLQAALEFDDATGAREIIERLRGSNGLGYARVLDADDHAVAEGLFDPTAQPPPSAAIGVGSVVEIGNWLHASVAVTRRDNGKPGRVIIGFSRAEERAEVWSARLAASGLAALVVVAGAIAAFFIGRSVARPIEELTRITSDIVSTGDLRRPVVVSPTSEEIMALA